MGGGWTLDGKWGRAGVGSASQNAPWKAGRGRRQAEIRRYARRQIIFFVIGVALTAATTSSPLQDNFFSLWGYDKGAITSGPEAGKYVPAGIDVSSRSRVLRRDTIAGVLQFKPSEKFEITLDGLYIKFSDAGISRGFIEALPVASDGSTVISSTSTYVTSARTTGFNSVLRSDPLDRRGDLKTFGGNLKYNPTSDLHATLGRGGDFSSTFSEPRHSRSRRSACKECVLRSTPLSVGVMSAASSTSAKLEAKWDISPGGARAHYARLSWNKQCSAPRAKEPRPY